MRKPHLMILLVCCLSATALGQNSRTFDNFDRSQGVQVHVPVVAAPADMVNKRTKRVKRNGRWVVVVDNKLVRKTGQSSAVKVTDGLAHRDSGFTAARLAMGTGTHLKGFTTGDPAHDTYIVDSSKRYGIDPLLIYAQMHQESSFKLRATSHKGASGLMQLMPATARRFGVTKIYDPKQNIEAGVKYMRWLLDTFNGDVVLALAGYNAGEGAVMKYGRQVPPYRETREYVRRITARYNSISDPRYIQSARRLTPQTAANLNQKQSRPLAVLEPSPFAVRLPDGKMMLMNQ